MKISHYKLVFVFMAFVALAGCKKNEPLKAEEILEPQSITDLKVNKDFNWTTYQDVNFKVNGIAALASENNTLTVTSLDGKSLFVTGNYSMADNIDMTFNLPKVVEQVKVSFGSISKIVTITDNQIIFSYISDTPQDEN